MSELKYVLSIRESNFNGKNGATFSHLLTVRAEGTDPPPRPAPLIVSLIVKRPFFLTTFLLSTYDILQAQFLIFRLAMFVFHTLVNCSALAFFIFSRLKLVPPTAERSVHDHQIHYFRER